MSDDDQALLGLESLNMAEAIMPVLDARDDLATPHGVARAVGALRMARHFLVSALGLSLEDVTRLEAGLDETYARFEKEKGDA